MRSLRSLQQNLQGYLLRQEATIFADIISTRVTSSARLDIYRDGYFLRLLDALANDYPVLKTLVGAEKFTELGTRYINALPSVFRSVRWFGQQLPAFLRAQQDLVNQDWLPELAEFEWLLTEAFDEADLTCIDLTTMAAIAPDQWPTMFFTLHPSVRRFDLNWNVVTLWNHAQENKPLVPAQHETMMPWVIYRHNLDVQFYSLPPAEAYMLDAMLAQENFAEICAGLCEWVAEADAPMTAASLLKRFVEDSMIIEVQHVSTT
jgi:hypothetical protein